MSGGLMYFVNSDGTQVLFDPSSEKYYTLVTDDQLAENVYLQHQALNQPRRNQLSVKSSSHQSNRTVVQNNSKNQQKQLKQATTWQKSSEQNTTRTAQRTIALTGRNCTSREREQVPLKENEEKNENNGTDSQMTTANFEQQEQEKTMSSTLKHQETCAFHENNQNQNQNENWKIAQSRRNNRRMNTGNDIDNRQHSETFPNSNKNNNINFDVRQQHQLPSLSHSNQQ
jgi:hypothetical protein